jgi:hypothetical protein
MELNESPRLVRLIALAAATVVLSALPANAARDSDMRSLKLTFYAEDATSKTLKDSAPFGDTPTKGDVIRLTWRLVNSGRQFGRASGATVGTAVQTFTFTSRSKAAVTQLTRLPTGTIRTSGILDVQGFTQTWQVVGGTRAFAGARGRFELTPLLGPDSQAQAYFLRLP